MTTKFEMAAFTLKDEHLFVVSEDPEVTESTDSTE